MNAEQIERRLKAAFDATEHIAPPPHLDVSRVVTTHQAGTRSRVLAVAAVAVAVVGVAALLYAVLRPANNAPNATHSSAASVTDNASVTRSSVSVEPPSTVPTAPVSTDSLNGASLGLPGQNGHYRPVHVLSSVPSGHYVSMPWRLLKVLRGGRALGVEYLVGNGYTELARGFVVLESSKTVELIAITERVPVNCPSGMSCAVPQPLDAGVGIVRLAEPLRDRALLHAPVSSPSLQKFLDRRCCPNSPSSSH